MLNVEELKKEYIGTAINWLTILDVFRDDKDIVTFSCKCKCGNIVNIKKKVLLGNHSPMSCGCYRYSDEYKRKRAELCKINNTSFKMSESRKKWCKENQDKVKLNNDKIKQYYTDNPEQRKIIGDRISKWYHDNPDLVKEKSNSHSEWYKNNKDAVSLAVEKRLNYLKDHPEIEHERIHKISEWHNSNSDKFNSIIENNKSIALHKRSLSDYSKLIEIIDPLQVDDLLSGNIKSGELVYTKCPNCGIYAPHKINDVFILSKSKFKYDKAPLCRQCHIELTSCFYSKYEQEIADYISEFYSDVCIKNSRDILCGKELDLYYPNKKIAIEFNSDYWHDENHKPKDYHFNKFNLCLEKGIILVSIFELYWINNKDKVKIYLKDLFNSTNNNLSFEKSGYMNNNYPAFECNIDLNSILEESYTTKNSLVYTCGYSLIVK